MNAKFLVRGDKKIINDFFSLRDNVLNYYLAISLSIITPRVLNGFA
jgi:hypothetical protein